jgi:hypothetical protein
MMAMRAALLMAAAAVSLIALGVADADLQPSALRLMVGVVFALLAPLFWPGCAPSRQGTALRVVAWSAAACGMAALAMLWWGGGRQSLLGVLQSCAMLSAILLLSHALAALLEHGWSNAPRTAEGDAREAAGRAVALLLTLLGSLPLWLGPMAELLSVHHAWAIDASLGLSPLTHLAVASGNDLLRNAWLYQHSNLAGLQADYPGLAGLAWFYVTLLLGVLAMTAAHSDRPMEKTR